MSEAEEAKLQEGKWLFEVLARPRFITYFGTLELQPRRRHWQCRDAAANLLQHSA